MKYRKQSPFTSSFFYKVTSLVKFGIDPQLTKILLQSNF